MSQIPKWQITPMVEFRKIILRNLIFKKESIDNVN